MSNRSLGRFTVVLVSLVFTSALFAANEIGAPAGGGSFMEWQVRLTGHQAIELSVLGPGGQLWTKSFTAGRNPAVQLSDLGSPDDGQYNYELRLVARIPEGIRRQLSDARARGDEEAIKRITREAGLDQQVVQSGHFTILNGTIVAPDGVEPDANDSRGSSFGVTSDVAADGGVRSDQRPSRITVLDQVIPDDLIVQSSICAGFDCVDGESFGFDTLRLKENNLRLNFDDTSTSAGFPANDWRIIANDSASGGANKFSIEDSTAARNPMTIEAAAPANALYVDSTGNVGLQQAAPALDFHMTQSDTPAIRMEQTNAGGFTAQTWDIGANEANFFVRDVTGGSRLSFRIRPGAPTSSIDIASTGFVGINTGSAKRNLHVVGTAGAVTTFPTVITETDGLVLENNSNTHMSMVSAATSSCIIRLLKSGSTDTRGFVQYTHSTDTFNIGAAGTTRVTVGASAVGIGNSAPTQPLMVGVAGSGSGGNGAHVTAGGTWTNGSSRSFKQDIQALDADEARQALSALQPVRYHYKAEPDEEYVGFIAEEVPELVAQTSTGRKYLSPMDIVATLTKVVQEQQKTIDDLSKKVEQLQNQKQ